MAVKIIWSSEMDAKLIELNPNHNAKYLSHLFGLSQDAVKRRRKFLGLSKDDRRTIWNDENEAYMAEHYPNTKIKDLAVEMGLSENAIIAKAFMMRLLKTPEFRTKVALEGSVFQKNHGPWNKGMKGLQCGGVHTQFKAGNLPHNTRKDGDSSIRKDKKGNSHEYIRVSLGIWIERKILVWKEHHGEIPKKMVIRVIDGDTLNTSIENLEMITMKENRIRNSGVVSLNDNYIATLLTRKNPESHAEIVKNKELIELQRTIIKSNRLCKKLKKEMP
jgi:HNH endonuclease